jgi:phage-related protein
MMISSARSGPRFSWVQAKKTCGGFLQLSGARSVSRFFEAQLGDHPHNAKPLKGFSGVLEIRASFDGDTYRAVYAVRFEGVLHAFQKKSTSGKATPQRHIDLIRQRLKDAETIHKANKGNR